MTATNVRVTTNAAESDAYSGAVARGAEVIVDKVAEGSRGNILLVSLYYSEANGSAPPLRIFTEAMSELGYGVTVITARPFYPTNRVFEEYRDGSRDVECQGSVQIRRVFGRDVDYRSIKARVAADFAFARAAYSYMRGMPPAKAIFSVCPPPFSAIAANLIARRMGARHIAIVHDIPSGLAQALGMVSMKLLSMGMRWVERVGLNGADHIVTLSDGMTEVLRDNGVTRPVDILPPMVDDASISPQPEQDGPPLVVYSGNMGRKQGLGIVVELAKILEERGSPARVLLRGDGVFRPELEAMAVEAGVSNLSFAGFTPDDQFSQSLAEGHVFLVPQDPVGASYCVPGKLYTLMAASRPFVCTALPGSPLDSEREASGAFFISPPGDAEALADAVEKLIASPGLRAELGASGRAYVEKHVGREAQKAAYEALIEGNKAP